MAKIISIQKHQEERRRYIFKFKTICCRIDKEEKVNVPCIGMYDFETGIIAANPKLERYYLMLNDSSRRASETLRKRACYICDFLNYILWNTRINDLAELDFEVLRDFLVDFRTDCDGRDRNPAEWERGVTIVYLFILEYAKKHRVLSEKIKKENLITSERVVYKKNKRVICYNCNTLGVKKSKKQGKKNRCLHESYMDILLFEATKYDPMLALAMALQAYAGLREGEIVNLTRSSIVLRYAGHGCIGSVDVLLKDEAPFAKTWNKKTDFGKIKVYRTAHVYPDFIDKILKYYNLHDDMLELLNASKEPDAPLFLNKWGNSLSVNTYEKRVKKLFYEHFVPGLKELCVSNNAWAINAPYIEAYEQGYPGAHMFRHWFTMYLVKHVRVAKNQDIIDKIIYYRGDQSREAMEEYIHFNEDVAAIYDEVAQQFQKSLMEEIL